MNIRSQKILTHSQPKQYSFKERAIRDLAWSLCHTPLFDPIPDFADEWFIQDYVDQGLWPWLADLDQSPQKLHEHLSHQRSTRLGIYFEQLLSFYFECYPRFTLLAKNHQVSNGERTLGEFDFIVFDKKFQHVKHIEVAVKFYLGHKNYNKTIANNAPFYNWHHWVGPNERDTLAIKMRHLQQHQLPLGKTHWGKQALSTLIGKNKEYTSRLLICGRFYFPKEYTLLKPDFSSESNNNFWIDSSRALKNTGVFKKNKYYCLLPRNYWLSEIIEEDIDHNTLSLFSEHELKKFVMEKADTNNYEWQFSEIEKRNGKMIETGRFFIINKKAPQTKSTIEANL